MKEKIKNYVVSSANWDILVDAESARSAAISATIFAFQKYGDKLLMSTIIMVNEEEYFHKKSFNDINFFASHEILRDVGLDDLSFNFLELTKNIHETKSIK